MQRRNKSATKKAILTQNDRGNSWSRFHKNCHNHVQNDETLSSSVERKTNLISKKNGLIRLNSDERRRLERIEN